MRVINAKHEGLLTKWKAIQQPELAQPATVMDAGADNEHPNSINHDEKIVGSRRAHEAGIPHEPIISGEQKPVNNQTPNDASLAVDLYPPWDIKSIQEGLGGRYDRETIIDMLQRCRGDIDRAFAALLDEGADVPFDKKAVPVIPIKPSLQASRSSSPFSTGSKRSADDSDDSEDPRPARHIRSKKRLVSNLTLGVGISFRDEHDEVVSLNLRVSSPSSIR